MDDVIEGYSEQHNVQVTFATQEIFRRVAERYPIVLEIVIQSENASSYSLQEHIPFNCHLRNNSGMQNIVR